MIDDDVVGLFVNVEAVPIIYNPGVSEADMAKNDVVRFLDIEQVFAGERNTIPWSRLTGNSDVGIADFQEPLQFNRPTNAEDDDAWPFRLDSGSKATGATIVEVSDFDDSAAAAANCIRSKPLCAGKGTGWRDVGRGWFWRS